METKVLTMDHSSDVEELLTRRIQLIQRDHEGGIAGFFDRVSREGQRRESEDCERDLAIALVAAKQSPS